MDRDLSYLVDILQAARKINDLAQDVTKEAFLEDELRHTTVVYQLMVVGEATKRLSDEFRDQHPLIPWRRMAGMRDILIHNYRDVDLELVWEVSIQSIPDLITEIEPLIPPEE